MTFAGRVVTTATVAALFALAAGCFAWSYVVFSNLWADYKDSSDQAYIMFGSIGLGLGLLFSLSGVAVLRVSLLRLAIPCLALAGLFPYSVLFGSAAVVLNGLLLGVAVLLFVWLNTETRIDGRSRS